jgi:hypothetical protein
MKLCPVWFYVYYPSTIFFTVWKICHLGNEGQLSILPLQIITNQPYVTPFSAFLSFYQIKVEESMICKGPICFTAAPIPIFEWSKNTIS